MTKNAKTFETKKTFRKFCSFKKFAIKIPNYVSVFLSTNRDVLQCRNLEFLNRRFILETFFRHPFVPKRKISQIAFLSQKLVLPGILTFNCAR